MASLELRRVVLVPSSQRQRSRHLRLHSTNLHFRFGVGELSAINGVAGCKWRSFPVTDYVTYSTSFLRACPRHSYRRYTKHLATQSQAYATPHPWRWKVRKFSIHPHPARTIARRADSTYAGLTRTKKPPNNSPSPKLTSPEKRTPMLRSTVC